MTSLDTAPLQTAIEEALDGLWAGHVRDGKSVESVAASLAIAIGAFVEEAIRGLAPPEQPRGPPRSGESG